MIDTINNMPTRTPLSTVYEHEGRVIIRLEMPGVSKDGVDIRVEDNRLSVRGTPGNGYHGEYRVRERRRGQFLMDYTIDNTIDRNRVDAELRNGVLELRLERKESEKPRRIAVKAS